MPYPSETDRRENPARLLLSIYLPALLLLSIIGLASRHWSIPVGHFTRDPLQMLHQPPYLGLVSHLGTLMWWTGGSVGVFAAAVLRGAPAGEKTRLFLLWAGILTLWVAVDDLFMLHEVVIPQMFHVREQIIYILYGFVAVYCAIRFKAQVFQRHVALVWLTVVFSIISIVMDNWHALATIVGRPILPEN